ncbi:SDR family oxidoreductase [[Mycobacterium] wendilense]|uniref:SDR family oxidoreductase n=1 Tax=[Mycobacterium] wendilense TaxID=3064284 RepID=A0ABM9MK95_9MYCO|nr:SDR family oxidoreductase [Mycolicibacterium sp. MU0050]CAJ1587308.1 SDR family oxidoreductase [Mycolicibacterium sp. MU0050]
MTNRISFDFAGTQVLITGGTSGLGHATACLFRDSGAAVTITGTKASPAEYPVDLSGMAYRALALTDNAAIDALAASFSTLDVLVNNAGVNFPGGLDESTPDGFAASVDINLTAQYRLTVALESALRASALRGGASVVTLASMAAIRATTVVPGYGAAKAGVLSMTRALAARWAAAGIRVNAVTPGVVATRMTAPMEHFPEIKQAELDHIPLGRFAEPAEVAGVIAFMCSERASYCTGSSFVVDGGYSLQ